jgi:predicted XRE-type DNA-binding protein
MENERIAVTSSCGNVYEDLGLPDAGTMLVKAQLAVTIKRILADKGLTQTKAAEILGISQPRLSGLLRGQFRSISEAKMLECITRLGRDIHIVVAPVERLSSGHGQIEVRMGA